MKKKTFILSTLLAVALATVILFVSCPTSSSSGDGTSGTSQPLTFTASSDDGDVEIIFSKTEIGRAAAPANNDFYVIKLNGSEISRGRVKIDGSTLTFTSDAGNVFNASLSGGILVVPIILKDDGSAPVSGIIASSGGTGDSAPTETEYVVNNDNDFMNAIEKAKFEPGNYTINVKNNITYTGDGVDFKNNPRGKITIKGTGKITWNASTYTNSFWLTGGFLVLDIDIECNFSKGGTAFEVEFGMIEMKGGTLKSNFNNTGGENTNGVWLGNSSTFLMSGGEITGFDAGVGITGFDTNVGITGESKEGPGNVIAIKNGNITGNGNAIYVSGNRKHFVNIVGGTISGNDTGVKLWDGNGHFVNMTGGTISGNSWGLIIGKNPNSGFKKTGGSITNNSDGAISIESSNSKTLLQLLKNAPDDESGNYEVTINSAGTGIASKRGNW